VKEFAYLPARQLDGKAVILHPNAGLPIVPQQPATQSKDVQLRSSTVSKMQVTFAKQPCALVLVVLHRPTNNVLSHQRVVLHEQNVIHLLENVNTLFRKPVMIQTSVESNVLMENVLEI